MRTPTTNDTKCLRFCLSRYFSLLFLMMCIGVVQAQVPGVPTNLVATGINTGGTIEFTAPESDGKSPITNYEYSTDNGATWLTPSPAITSSPLNISSGLINCTSYQIKIRAVNAVGHGTESSGVQLIPAATTPPTSFTSDGINYVVTSPTTVAVGVNASATGVVVIPDEVTTACGTYAVTSINNSAFQGRAGLTSVTIPNSVTSIGSGAFASSGLTSIILPNSVTSIAGYAFYGCSGLTSVTLPNAITSINDGIFNGCSQLSSITIPNSVTSIGNQVFQNCTRLTSVAIPNTVTSIGNQVFQYCSGLTSVSISNSVPSIGNQFFQFCTSLISVTIPNSVTSIGQNAFQGCSSLGSVTLSNSLTSIGSGAFNSCGGLSTITIPNSVTSIGTFAFYSCTGLTSVICNVSSPITIAANVFSGVNQAACSLAVPNTSVADYQVAAVWKDFSPIVCDPTDNITSVSACGSYTWENNGQTYTTSGVYTGVTANCVTEKLDLTITFTTPPSASVQTFVGSKTVADLVATGADLKWYDVATNGTELASTTAITTGTYYVTQTLTSCESARISVAVTVTPPSLPGTPTNLVATGINTGGTIEFTAPESDGGSPITNYEYSTDNGATWLTPSPAITSSPLNISSGLINCTSYQIKIRAVNAVESGTASDAVQLIPVPSVNIGVKWTQRTSASNNDWNSVTYGNGIFVAVSSTGTGDRVMTSPDGVTWTAQISAVDNEWTSVTYGNGKFVAVARTGTGDRVMTSLDGINWTAQTSAADDDWRSVTYGNGLFVAVAFTGEGNRVMTSEDGVTWTARTSAASNNWTSVTYGNGKFVAVAEGGNGNLVMTSPDGINWSPQTSVEDNSWNSVTYGNGLFVAVSSSETGYQVMTSEDGITWTAQVVANRGKWASVTYGNGLFVAVANEIFGNPAIVSTDGINWSNGAFPATTYYSSVTYGNGIFVVVSNRGAGTKVITSDKVADAPVINAITPRNNGLSVGFTQANSVNVSPILNYEYSTDNGNNWAASASSTSPITITGLTNGTAYTIKIRAINAAGTSCASSAFLATPTLGTVADAPTNLVVTPINTGGIIVFTPPVNDGGSDISNYQYSIDNGSTWITPSPAIKTNRLVINNGLTNCTTYQLKLRAVNDVGVGAESSVQLIPAAVDVLGASWTSRTSAVNNDWQSVTYGNGKFVAVANTGTNNRIMTSDNGIDWTIRTPPADNNWLGVTYGNGLFVAVSANGSTREMYSANGIDWNLGTNPANSNQWVSVTYGNGLFVAVSRVGLVMTSSNGITWTSRTSAANNNWTSVTYGNGKFVAVASSGTNNRVMTSPDGVTWTARTSAANNGWNSVTYGNGLFVAVASDGTNRVMTSPDGIVWTTRTSDVDNGWRSVTYGNGLFVAVAVYGNNNRVMTSYDGITWTSRTSAAGNAWNSVTYGNNLFVSVSSSGVMTSSFASAPDAPVITSAILGSTSTVNFTQSGPVNASAISNYEYSTDNGTNWSSVSPETAISPLTITGLAEGTNSIMLRAVSMVGNSCPSNTFSCSTPSTPSVNVVNNCGSSTLTASNNTGSLLWSTGETTSSIIVNSAGTYTVTQLVGSCRSVAGSVNALPKSNDFPVTATGANVCTGSSFTLKATGGVSYRWTGPNGFTSSVQNPTVSNAQLVKAGTYTVTITSAEGCSKNATAIVTILVSPLLSVTPLSQTICTGSSITPIVFYDINNQSGTTYSWKRDNTTFINGVSSSSGSVQSISGVFTNNTTSVQFTTFTIKASNCKGSSTKTVTLTVNPSVAISKQPSAVSINSGKSTYFEVEAKGVGITYQWQLSTNGGGIWSNVVNNTIYTGATTNKISITKASLLMNGYLYRCIVTSSACGGPITSSSAKLTVKNSSTITSSFNPVNSQVEAGKSFNIHVSPNPSAEVFKVYVTATGNELVDIMLTDLRGKIIKSFKVKPNESIQLGDDLAAATYIVIAKQGSNVSTRRIVKL